jgi:dethiobiotin synthetase
MTTVFVTATGTGVGKTFVTARLVAELRAARRSVLALKPVASGFDADNVAATDTGVLLDALGLHATRANLDAVSPWRFAAPLSPDMAAERERRTIPFDELLEFCRAPRPADVTLIEGIGGVMVPLDHEHTVLDWIVELRAPVLLVAGSYLGTLSHTLTAAAALRARGVDPSAVIVSESQQQPVPLEETAAAIQRFVTPAAVAVLPRVTTLASIGANVPMLLPLLAHLLSRSPEPP